MNFENKYRLFIPKHLNDKEEVNLIIMHDGQYVFEDNEVNQGKSMEIHHFIEENEIPVAILAIDNIRDLRFSQYCPFESGEYSIKSLGFKREYTPTGDQYISWLVEDLIPEIAESSNLKFKSITMAGISLGGLISLYALLKYPDKIHNVISVSGAFYINQEQMEALIDNTNLSNNHYVYLDYGSSEARENEHLTNCFIESNKRIFKLLEKQNIKVESQGFENHEHHYKFFKPRMKEAILCLL